VLEARSYDDSRRGDGVDVGYCDALDAAPDDVVGRIGDRPVASGRRDATLCVRRKNEVLVPVGAHAAGGINFGDAGVGYAFGLRERVRIPHAGCSNAREAAERGMKLTKPERIGALQLIPRCSADPQEEHVNAVLLLMQQLAALLPRSPA